MNKFNLKNCDLTLKRNILAEAAEKRIRLQEKNNYKKKILSDDEIVNDELLKMDKIEKELDDIINEELKNFN
tara:strand:- start:783 stop:998 length:216 start_codon:yes stop_codon:yes gene_type:complete